MRNRYNSQDTKAYHITGQFQFEEVSHNNEVLEELWEFLCENFSDILSHNYHIHSLVLMSNHFHLLCSEKSQYFTFQNLSEPGFTQSVPFKLGQDLDYIQSLTECHFYTKYMDMEFSKTIIHPITNFHYFKTTYKYIYRNPVEAGLVKTAHHYPFSTLSQLFGITDKKIKLMDNMNLIQNPMQALKWIHRDGSTALH